MSGGDRLQSVGSRGFPSERPRSRWWRVLGSSAHPCKERSAASRRSESACRDYPQRRILADPHFSICSDPRAAPADQDNQQTGRYPPSDNMKVLSFAMLVVAILATGASAAAPEERNLRGAVEMYHSGAHQASHAHHPAMEAHGSFQSYLQQLKDRAKQVKVPKHNMEAQAATAAAGHKAQHQAAMESRVNPKQKGKKSHMAGKKKSSMEELPTPSDEEMPIAGALTRVSGGEEDEPEGSLGNNPQSDSVPQVIGGERGATMDASDPLQDYFEKLDRANEVDPPQYNKEAQAEAAIADARSTQQQQQAVAAESNSNLLSEGMAFEARLRNQKSATSSKGKKGKKGL